MCYSKLNKALSELQDTLGVSLVEALDLVWASDSQDGAPLPCDVRRELYHKLCPGSDSSSVDSSSVDSSSVDSSSVDSSSVDSSAVDSAVDSSVDSSSVDKDSQAPNPQDAYESKIDDPIHTFKSKAKVAFQKFFIAVRQVYEKITHRIQSDFWDSMVKSLKEMLQTVYQKIVEALTWLRDKVSNAAHAVWDAIQRLFQSLKNLFSRS
ncbi:uncharacterized protein [Dipodomys merriami]|uniref:uncharacterized protein n=1 Tax=Dipodomys merriami TaxID=94247 RepID=UPI00385599B3